MPLMTKQTLASQPSPYRSAGWSAIASGLIGIVAAGFLIAFLMRRDENIYQAVGYLGAHDLGVALQYLLLIPVVAALYRVALQSPPSISRWTLNIGIGALSLTALCLFLTRPKIVSDGLYSLPQGVFGVWLIWVSWRLSKIFSRSMRGSGMVVGLGLTLVGLFFVGYSIFVSSLMLKIPAASLEEAQAVPWTRANDFLHYFIWIGSYMGVYPLPFWTIWLGYVLLRKRQIVVTTRS